MRDFVYLFVCLFIYLEMSGEFSLRWVLIQLQPEKNLLDNVTGNRSSDSLVVLRWHFLFSRPICHVFPSLFVTYCSRPNYLLSRLFLTADTDLLSRSSDKLRSVSVDVPHFRVVRLHSWKVVSCVTTTKRDVLTHLCWTLWRIFPCVFCNFIQVRPLKGRNRS